MRIIEGNSCYSSKLTLPEGASDYLTVDNPRLLQLQARYDGFSKEVTAPLTWANEYIKSEHVLYFRGDNPYVWQLRGCNTDTVGYALASYYVKSIDKYGFWDKLIEDGQFGAFTFDIANKLVSRDLLDSILEIYFLDKYLNIYNKKPLTILDIGAGYGRLAHRMTSALPTIKEYICVDGVATSAYIAEYYLKFCKLQGIAKVVLLDEITDYIRTTSVDIAINIHSFSECTQSAISWWVSLLVSSNVEHLMVVPNPGNHGGKKLLTNDGKDFYSIIQNHGYTLLAKEPKYLDPCVQDSAIEPTYYYLFKLSSI